MANKYERRLKDYNIINSVLLLLYNYLKEQ